MSWQQMGVGYELADIEKVITGWERCRKCDMRVIAEEEGKKAYLECEYTMGLYCRQDRLIWDTIEVLKKMKEKYDKLAEWSEGHIVFCKDCKHYDSEGTCLKIGIAMLNDE